MNVRHGSIRPHVLINGFIVGGANGNAKVLMRAIGPSLANVGVNNALTDPTLELYDGNGVLLASNDNWKRDQQTQIEATQIPPPTDSEAAIVADLPPGLTPPLSPANWPTASASSKFTIFVRWRSVTRAARTT